MIRWITPISDGTQPPQTVEELWQAIQNYGGLTIPAGLTQEQVDAIRAQANDLLAAIDEIPDRKSVV